MTLAERAKKLITESLYLSLATSFDNNSWITPLWYAVDEDFSFYFISDKNSRHCKYIDSNSKVAFCIFNTNEIPDEVNGLQVEATASQVSLTEIQSVLKLIFSKAGSDAFKYDISDWMNPNTYSKLTNYRIYKIVPSKFYMLDPEAEVDNVRVEVTNLLIGNRSL